MLNIIILVYILLFVFSIVFVHMCKRTCVCVCICVSALVCVCVCVCVHMCYLPIVTWSNHLGEYFSLSYATYKSWLLINRCFWDPFIGFSINLIWNKNKNNILFLVLWLSIWQKFRKFLQETKILVKWKQTKSRVKAELSKF